MNAQVSRLLKHVTPLAFTVLLAGCYGSHNNALPRGQAAYALIPSAENGQERNAIQAGDRVSVRVLGEPDLSTDQAWVDGTGMIQVPLAGDIKASGLTPQLLRAEIQERLGRRFIRNPMVTVTVVEHAKQAITVEGEVQKSGLFEAPAGLTLLGALALAQSTTRDAALDEVVIFRQIDGQRMAARFNIADIRSGKAADPQILAGDAVVVGRSSIKSIWRDFLAATPAFSIFYLFR